LQKLQWPVPAVVSPQQLDAAEADALPPDPAARVVFIRRRKDAGKSTEQDERNLANVKPSDIAVM
jgi:hypothetical protein